MLSSIFLRALFAFSKQPVCHLAVTVKLAFRLVLFALKTLLHFIPLERDFRILRLFAVVRRLWHLVLAAGPCTTAEQLQHFTNQDHL